MSFSSGFIKTAEFSNYDVIEGAAPNSGLGYDPRLHAGSVEMDTQIAKKSSPKGTAAKRRQLSNKESTK
jgi:hypothetical protein